MANVIGGRDFNFLGYRNADRTRVFGASGAVPALWPKPQRHPPARRTIMLSDVTATATNKGDIAVIITDAAGNRVQAEIPIELAEKLKAQIEAALPTARIRANRR